jgi:rhodanese-related sulfurtransferase
MVEKTHGIVIDVRDQAEYNFKHIPDAININVESADFTDQINKLDKGKNYFVYYFCRYTCFVDLMTLTEKIIEE